MVNSQWSLDVAVLSTHCSPDLELFTIKVRPFYLPPEFSCVIISAVYIPPQADKMCALEELYRVINGLENAHPKAASIVVGDFNKANMRKVIFFLFFFNTLFLQGQCTIKVIVPELADS